MPVITLESDLILKRKNFFIIIKRRNRKYEKLHTLTKSLKADYYIMLRNNINKLDFHLPLQCTSLKDRDDETAIYVSYLNKEKKLLISCFATRLRPWFNISIISYNSLLCIHLHSNLLVYTGQREL